MKWLSDSSGIYSLRPGILDLTSQTVKNNKYYRSGYRQDSIKPFIKMTFQEMIKNREWEKIFDFLDQGTIEGFLEFFRALVTSKPTFIVRSPDEGMRQNYEFNHIR